MTLDEENEDREDFLTSIGLNPVWLHEMKAALAINKKEYKTAVKHLIGGKFYNRAHNVSRYVILVMLCNTCYVIGIKTSALKC